MIIGKRSTYYIREKIKNRRKNERERERERGNERLFNPQSLWMTRSLSLFSIEYREKDVVNFRYKIIS